VKFTIGRTSRELNWVANRSVVDERLQCADFVVKVGFDPGFAAAWFLTASAGRVLVVERGVNASN